MKSRLLLFLLLFQLFQAKAQQQFSLFFDSNKHELAPNETQKLQSWISSHGDVKIVAINGYADEDGSVSHNDSLSQRRVNFVLKQISGKVKVREDFRTRSFGESRQLSKVKAENRKVDVFYIEAKDLPREDEILGIKKETPAPKPERIVSYPEKLKIDNPDGTTSEYKLDVAFMQQMTKAKAGEKLAVPNLNFVINTFAVVPASRSKLYELLLVLQRNPDLKVEIQGHLCCMPVDRLDLSTQRAKAVYMFLVQNNIDKSRLSYKGFGSTQPIFPLPEKTEEERAANRRVEIQIISN
jgi:outer membrane protein OmpA-like peptidoglycan-associated protein